MRTCPTKALLDPTPAKWRFTLHDAETGVSRQLFEDEDPATQWRFVEGREELICCDEHRGWQTRGLSGRPSLERGQW